MDQKWLSTRWTVECIIRHWKACKGRQLQAWQVYCTSGIAFLEISSRRGNGTQLGNASHIYASGSPALSQVNWYMYQYSPRYIPVFGNNGHLFCLLGSCTTTVDGPVGIVVLGTTGWGSRMQCLGHTLLYIKPILAINLTLFPESTVNSCLLSLNQPIHSAIHSGPDLCLSQIFMACIYKQI